ncbi:MAG: hypothetical protein HKN12_10905, partial [Gemmatimonadetes bacterium]|nr:hypothetical protein [Gemmatimonadota bacterium]
MTPLRSTQRPRVLHLAFEDPRAPSSGGGAIRTREVCSRISDFDTDVVCYSFPGARARWEGGSRWSHLGWSRSSKCLQLGSYFLGIPGKLLANRYDLIVEDFAPPWTFAFTPLFTRAPVVAVVQWLFAQEMQDKYGVPVGKIERLGLSCYRNFIVMAECMKTELSSRVPEARVCVAGCAVDEALFDAEPADRGYLLYLGRLDTHQKGLDLLLDTARKLPDGVRLKIA